MNKTQAIKLQSLGEHDVFLHRLTLVESISLSRQKDSYFGFLQRVVTEISTLDPMQIERMTIQDAIALTVYYRMYFWNDMSITEGESLSPSNFIGAYSDELKEDSFIINIGEYRFSPFISLRDAIDAERYALSVGDIDNIRFYIMGAGCTRKGYKDGVDTLLSLMDGTDDVGLLLQYDKMISEISNINLTFMQGEGKISILTQGGEPMALPFWGSRFFSFGI
ncbi:MAG: hypothetical protein GQ474_05950 [Sulfurimonas sp.]|nr:hypothetical protein [Sulfurimonas sp.]